MEDTGRVVVQSFGGILVDILPSGMVRTNAKLSKSKNMHHLDGRFDW